MSHEKDKDADRLFAQAGHAKEAQSAIRYASLILEKGRREAAKADAHESRLAIESVLGSLKVEAHKLAVMADELRWKGRKVSSGDWKESKGDKQ
jgi:hypothetical protein